MSKKTTKPGKPRKPKKKVVVHELLNLRHDYTQDERNVLTNELTRALQQTAEQEEQLKAISADMKARIKSSKSKVSEVTNKLTNGYEMRQVETTVEFDRKKGKKKYFFNCPGNKEFHRKFIREDDMTATDYERLPLDLPPDKPKEAPPAAGEQTGDPLKAAAELQQKMTENQIPPDGKSLASGESPSNN